jgi:3-oxoacyl-[acyl-carrier protein] reductase
MKEHVMELAGKVALVTGGSRGIGAAVAQRLASDGAAVALTYANAAGKAADVARQIEDKGGRAVVIQADHADPATAARAVQQTVDQLGGLDILVNNAGIFSGGPLDEIAEGDLDRILAVDVKAIFLACQAAAWHMGEGGRIITIGSALAERVPGATFTLYSMAKSALGGLTKGLARDLGPRGIRVTLIQAGAIDTDMNPENGPAGDFLRGVTALGHYGRAEDVAALVAYLASDGGRYVTGTAITIDGGLAA